MAWFYWFYPPVARFYTWFWGGSGAFLRRFQAALPQPRQMQASCADAGDFGAPHVGDWGQTDTTDRLA